MLESTPTSPPRVWSVVPGASAAVVAGWLDAIVVLVWPAAVWVVLATLAVVAIVAFARYLARSSGSAADAPDDVGAERSEPATGGLDEDEQFVVDLLLSNGGRVRQSAVVETSGWSKSKVSRLLSRMERDGHVEKVAVGRENLVVLVGLEREV